MGADLQKIAKENQDIDYVTNSLLTKGRLLFQQFINYFGDNLDALKNPNEAKSFCNRIVYYMSRELDWFNEEYLRKANFKLGLSPLSTRFDVSPQKKQEECDKILNYYLIKFKIFEWLVKKEEKSGCEYMREVILDNIDSVLEGSPYSVKREAISKLSQLNQVMYNIYEYWDYIFEKLLENISLDELENLLENEIIKVLPYSYRQCCRLVRELNDFTWVEEDGLYQNLVTGVYVEQIPTGIKKLNPLPTADIQECSGKHTEEWLRIEIENALKNS